MLLHGAPLPREQYVMTDMDQHAARMGRYALRAKQHATYSLAVPSWAHQIAVKITLDEYRELSLAHVAIPRIHGEEDRKRFNSAKVASPLRKLGITHCTRCSLTGPYDARGIWFRTGGCLRAVRTPEWIRKHLVCSLGTGTPPADNSEISAILDAIHTTTFEDEAALHRKASKNRWWAKQQCNLVAC
jgi:hypothetical protein